MGKFIFFVLVVWLVFYLFKKSIGQSKTHDTHDKSQEQNNNTEKMPNRADGQVDSQAEDQAEDMVQCSTCAVHLPRSEAFLVSGKFYCSQAHIKKNEFI